MEKMPEIYHRTGEPGGSGCNLTALEIFLKSPSGELMPGLLLDAGINSTEVELLRTIVLNLSIRWGKDELGWWACVPKSLFDDK